MVSDNDITSLATSVTTGMTQLYQRVLNPSLHAEFLTHKQKALELKHNINTYETEASKYEEYTPVQKSALNALTDDVQKLNMEAEETSSRVKDRLEESTRLPNENSNREYMQDIKARETLVDGRMEKIQQSIKPYEDYLGLKVDNHHEDECLHFTLTCEDEEKVEHDLTFSLKVDGELYRVFDVFPVLDELDGLVTELNESNRLARFFCGIRKSFIRSFGTDTADQADHGE